MSKPKLDYFKPDDFKDIYKQIMKDGYFSRASGDMWETTVRPDDISDLANEKLSALIESWPVAYGCKTIRDDKWQFDEKREGSTFQARLAFITPIQREPCKHEPMSVLVKVGFGNPDEEQTICKHCGIELTATWTSKQ